VRFNYKTIPITQPHPAFPDETSGWLPILPIKLSHGHSRQTPRLEALVDSGAADTLFRADIGTFLGIDVESGIKTTLGGFVVGSRTDVHYHRVTLWVGEDAITITAGFVSKLSVAAILGRRGFFEYFIVTFDPSATPPGFDIQRLGRA
jgi:hypothetical protein